MPKKINIWSCANLPPIIGIRGDDEIHYLYCMLRRHLEYILRRRSGSIVQLGLGIRKSLLSLPPPPLSLFPSFLPPVLWRSRDYLEISRISSLLPLSLLPCPAPRVLCVSLWCVPSGSSPPPMALTHSGKARGHSITFQKHLKYSSLSNKAV